MREDGGEVEERTGWVGMGGLERTRERVVLGLRDGTSWRLHRLVRNYYYCYYYFLVNLMDDTRLGRQFETN